VLELSANYTSLQFDLNGQNFDLFATLCTTQLFLNIGVNTTIEWFIIEVGDVKENENLKSSFSCWFEISAFGDGSLYLVKYNARITE